MKGNKWGKKKTKGDALFYLFLFFLWKVKKRRLNAVPSFLFFFSTWYFPFLWRCLFPLFSFFFVSVFFFFPFFMLLISSPTNASRAMRVGELVPKKREEGGGGKESCRGLHRYTNGSRSATAKADGFKAFCLFVSQNASKRLRERAGLVNFL